MIAALTFFFFNINSKASRESLTIEVNKQKEEVVAFYNIRQFAEKYHDDIVEAYEANSYDGLEELSKDFFRERYTARSLGWRLEILDGEGEIKNKVAEDRGYSRMYHSSITVPVPRGVKNNFLTLELSAGTAFSGKFLEVGPAG